METRILGGLWFQGIRIHHGGEAWYQVTHRAGQREQEAGCSLLNHEQEAGKVEQWGHKLAKSLPGDTLPPTWLHCFIILPTKHHQPRTQCLHTGASEGQFHSNNHTQLCHDFFLQWTEEEKHCWPALESPVLLEIFQAYFALTSDLTTKEMGAPSICHCSPIWVSESPALIRFIRENHLRAEVPGKYE